MLERLQDRLQRIYEIDIMQQADEYLLRDHDYALNEVSLPDPDHQFSIYLPEDVLQTLKNDHPMDTLHQGNIHHFLIALEAVSHFIYLAWNSSREREISLFELELQAQVDKYISTMILIANQADFFLPQGLLTRLFLRHPFNSDIYYDDLECYRRANYYAYQYCKALQHNCIEEETRSLFTDLREFYRLTNQHKIDHITASL